MSTLSTHCDNQSVLITRSLSSSPAGNASAPQDGGAVSYSESHVPPVAGRMLTLSSTDDSPGSWHSLAARTGEAPGLSTIMCSLSSEGLSLTGQQYATSLLNLLHSDRVEMGPSMASGSKPEALPRWTLPQGFRESVDPPIDFEPGNPAVSLQNLQTSIMY